MKEKKIELPYGNRSAEAEHFFDEHNAECGHYKQTLTSQKIGSSVLTARWQFGAGGTGAISCINCYRLGRGRTSVSLQIQRAVEVRKSSFVRSVTFEKVLIIEANGHLLIVHSQS